MIIEAFHIFPMPISVNTGADLVYAGFDAHHDGVSEDFAIFGQRFPSLKSGLILKMHPVAGRRHLHVDANIISITRWRGSAQRVCVWVCLTVCLRMFPY